MTTLRTPTRTIEITMTGVTSDGYDDGIDYSGDYIGNLADPNLHECTDDDCNLDGTGHYHCDDETADWWVAHCRAMELHNDRVAQLTSEQREKFRAVAESDGTYNVDAEDQPGEGEALLDRLFGSEDDESDGNTTVTVDCRADGCGYSTDLSTISDTNPSRCPKCGATLYVSGTATEWEG